MPDYVSLITSEHRDKPKFAAMVQAVAGAFSDNYDVARSIPDAFDLDTAEGQQLDIIGLWVGQSRLIRGVLLIGFFGFQDNVVALNFGEEGTPSIGGRLYDEGEPTTGTSILADPEYRTILRAKIIRNHAKGTTAEIVRALMFLFAAPCVIDDPGNMGIGIAIGRPLTLVEQAIITGLDILPRPAGVRVAWRSYYNAAAYFGFEGQLNALPFGEEGSSTIGGLFAEEF